MKAMILAAGRGSRLKPLTDRLPKPLLTVGGMTLVEWHLHALRKAGIREVVINLSWLGYRIQNHLGNGSRFGVCIHYSEEPKEESLDTAGGVRFAQHLLGEEPFLVVNGDIWTDYPFSLLMKQRNLCVRNGGAFLVCVPNPDHRPGGDFYLESVPCETWGVLLRKGGDVSRGTLTFSGIGLYHPSVFSGLLCGQRYKMIDVFAQLSNENRLRGTCYQGGWFDVGTTERLQRLNDHLECLSRDVFPYFRG